MKKQMAIFFIMFISIVFAEDYYTYVNCYSQSEDFQLVDFVQITIDSKTDKVMKIHISKSLMPLPHVIEKTVVANKNKDKYEFNFIDGFGNKAFGYVKFLHQDIIEFFIDCDNFSEVGKDLARLYGDKYVLVHTVNSLDAEKVFKELSNNKLNRYSREVSIFN